MDKNLMQKLLGLEGSPSTVFGIHGDDRPPTHERDVPVMYQAPILGLNGRTLKALRGKRVLDLACGNGSLVKYLREQGVIAEGIDPRAPEGEYFTRRIVFGIGERQGFPVPDETYDMIVSFQNVPLNTTFTENADFWAERNRLFGDRFIDAERDASLSAAQYMISEMGRTLRKGGSAVIFPRLPYLEQKARFSLNMDNLKVQLERVKDKKNIREYARWEDDENGSSSGDVPDSYFHRTVIRKQN